MVIAVWVCMCVYECDSVCIRRKGDGGVQQW